MARPIRIFLPRKTFQPFIIALICLYMKKIPLNGLRRKPFSNEGLGLAMSCPKIGLYKAGRLYTNILFCTLA